MTTSSFPRPHALVQKKGRVLIIDDHAELVGALAAVLTTGPAAALGLDVMTASRGDRALELARSHAVDVAILDVKLPDVSGVDLIEPLRLASPHCEVVLMTGYATVDVAMGAMRSGAMAFLPKSFHPEDVLRTVEQAVARVHLKRERAELERRYRSLVDLTDVLVVALDQEDRVVLFNRKAVHLAGISADAAMGRNFIESWIAVEEKERVREALGQVRQGGQPREIEVRFVDNVHDGQGAGGPLRPVLPRRIRWHLSSSRNERGTEDFVYGIGVDVTERLALEKRAADAEALSAMGVLALHLAHEIRNPLNAAVLQLNMLGRDVDKLEVDSEAKAKLHRRARIVEGEVGRLGRLLTEFLELARPRGIVRHELSLASLADTVLELERESAEARGVRLVRQGTAAGRMMGDPEKLKQVVLNLVVNGIEAMKDGGELSIHVEEDADGGVQLVVRDTGPGIEHEVMSQVFDPFFTTKEGGTGLGLSIVRKIVEQHGGRIRIDTERRLGTRVTVSFP